MRRETKPNYDPCGRGRRIDSALTTYSAIVRDYATHYRANAMSVLRHYATMNSLTDAIHAAAFAELPNKKRHPHQYRLRKETLREVRRRLLAARNQMKRCETFDHLFHLVDERISSVFGVGELMVYDTAHRIGAYLQKQPRHVYLHSGTREGAKALGVGKGRGKLEVSEMPRAFRDLEPYEIEDCLCIYKKEVARINRR